MTRCWSASLLVVFVVMIYSTARDISLAPTRPA